MSRAFLRKTAIGLGIAVAATLVAGALYQIPFFRTMEMKTYDLRFQFLADPSEADRGIVLVEVDDFSLDRMSQAGLGRFPWPRDIYADLLDYLARGKPRVVMFDLLFLEEDRATVGSGQPDQITGKEADQRLVEVTRSLGRVVHALEVNDTFVSPAPPAASYHLDDSVPKYKSVKAPFPVLASASRMLGHTRVDLEVDGVVRYAIPFVRKDNAAYPSLPLATVMAALDLTPSDVRLDGQGLHVGTRVVPLVGRSKVNIDRIWTREMLLNYKGGVFRHERRDIDDSTYPRYSLWQLFYSEMQLREGEKPEKDPALFRDKIVLVGTSAAGLHDLFQTPFGAQGKMPGMQIHATVIDNILNNSYMRPAHWTAEVALLFVSALVVGLLGVFLGFWWSLAAAVGVLLGDGAIGTGLFRSGVWIPCVPAVTGVFIAQFSGVAYKYFVEDREKRKVRGLFSRYVSPAVVKELIEDPSRARLGGQRREMTVLFSDIRGFTTFSEAGQPEDVIRQLNEYFARMVALLFEHRGTLDKFVGDMIMALFNAPTDDPDHPDQAVKMALDMMKELQVLNQRWTSEGRPNFDIGIGINTGEMIVGNVGSENTLSYTVIGDNVNLGSRLESLNKEYESHIIISEATRKQLKGQYFIRSLGDVKVKGKTKAVQIFEVCRSEEELLSREQKSPVAGR